MSKITNDGLTRSGTGWFISVPIWQQWAQRANSWTFDFLYYWFISVQVCRWQCFNDSL